MSMNYIRVSSVLACAFLLASCGRKPETAGAAAKADAKSEEGTLKTIVGYGTGATQVKAGQEAARQLKAIDADRKAQMDEFSE